MINGRAVVAGAGMAGLAAASALAANGWDVQVVERDRLSDSRSPRPGVPQGSQLHNLLTRAQRHLEELLPGFLDRLAAAGAGFARVAEDTYVYELGIVMPRRDLGISLVSAPQPLIEQVARSCLQDRWPVPVHMQTEVHGVSVLDGRVEGVTVLEGNRVREVQCDVFVDATGSRSAGTGWLESVGATIPQVEVQQRGQWYVTATFARPERWVGDRTFRLVFPTPPHSRGGLLSPIDARHWHASMSGRTADPMPTSFDDIVAYAHGLEDPTMGPLLAEATGVGEAHVFKRPSARWRRFDRLVNPLAGYLPIGDAVAALNPLYGQGISVAAWQAANLRALLAGPGGANLVELTSQHHAQTGATVGAAWDLGRTIDHELDGRSDIARALAANPGLHRRYVQVWHLLRPVSDLGAAFDA